MKASNNKEEKPHFVKRDKFAITAEYKQWFADIKSRLQNSQSIYNRLLLNIL